jgi:hypothetical protein
MLTVAPPMWALNSGLCHFFVTFRGPTGSPDTTGAVDWQCGPQQMSDTPSTSI